MSLSGFNHRGIAFRPKSILKKTFSPTRIVFAVDDDDDDDVAVAAVLVSAPGLILVSAKLFRKRGHKSDSGATIQYSVCL